MSPATDEQKKLEKQYADDRKKTDNFTKALLVFFILCILVSVALYVANNPQIFNW